ncbi:cysteine proteinase [Nadsonia fulvescens var. elongata DSM 6958]|uniref:Ubiquitin carboxyl-terminal hydrolase n=1 Tax=Nadsonia fulvescens var. elongata DSM 6958 TaxID=857566 RepID=A0A1E3PMY4_9ASCO|nr:cysteine proteinase [Nadsonia fulvescens var. elongata DSM 6958]
MSARKSLPGRSFVAESQRAKSASASSVNPHQLDGQSTRAARSFRSPLADGQPLENTRDANDSPAQNQDGHDENGDAHDASLPLAIPIPLHGTTTTVVAPNGCPHLQLESEANLKSPILENYRAIIKLCLFRMNEPLSPPADYETAASSPPDCIKRRKLENFPETPIVPHSIVMRCGDCFSLPSPSIEDWSLACLGRDCGFIGCRSHMKLHHKASSGKPQDHPGFAVDLKSNELAAVFCCECNDFIVDLQLEVVRKTTIQQYLAQKTLALSSRSRSKLRLSIFEKYNKIQKRQLISQQKLMLASSRFKHMVQTKGDLPLYKSTTGLRGFYNMGATCFISVVLQSFIHNPFIRNHFLSDGHNPANCTVGDSCLACSIDHIFMDFYGTSGILGYGPSNFLISAWKTKRSLAGYSEQDAHEFLQFILNELHVTSYHKSRYQQDIKQQNETDSQNDSDESGLSDHSSNGENIEDSDYQSEANDRYCQCITHRTFCGELQSNITCLSCGTITKTIDPMLDLSLEIRKKRGSASNPKAPKTLASSHDDNDSSNGAFHESLIGCLDRFTRAENLDVMYSCDTCKQKRHVSKQLVIKRLPNVLSIQLKRFQHIGTSSKVDTLVKFPLYINMAKYTTTSSNEIMNSATADPRMMYELFGVICHQGSINTGHYTCMIKNRDGNWYSFDDSTITMMAQAQVLATKNAYLLFYIVQGII